MDRDQATALYIALTDDQKVDLLARVAFDLTIVFRDIAYTQPQTAENLKKLQDINELQHQMIQQLGKHHRHDQRRYDDIDFLIILIKRAKNCGLLSHLQYSIERSLTSEHSS